MAKLVRTKDVVIGTGPAALKGDAVIVDVEGFLPRGDKVLSLQQIRIVLGERRVIAGLEAGV